MIDDEDDPFACFNTTEPAIEDPVPDEPTPDEEPMALTITHATTGVVLTEPKPYQGPAKVLGTFFTTITKDMLDGLKAMRCIIGKKAIKPMLRNVRIGWDGAQVVLEATNLETTIQYRLNRASSGPPVSFCAPLDIVLGVATAGMTITYDVGRNELKVGDAIVSVEDGDEFPATPELPTVGTGELFIDTIDAMKTATIAVAKEPSRFAFNGIRLQGDGTEHALTIIATDGKRMIVDRSWGFAMPLKKDLGHIIPSGVVNALAKTIGCFNGTMTMCWDDQRVAFTTPSVTVWTRLVDGPFPKYQSVIPKDTDLALRIGSKELHDVVKRSSAVLGEARAISISKGESSRIAFVKAQGIDCGRYEASLSAEWTAAVCQAISVNADFLIDGIMLLDPKLKSEVTLSVSGKDTPMVLKGTKQTPIYVLMPVTIRSA